MSPTSRWDRAWAHIQSVQLLRFGGSGATYPSDRRGPWRVGCGGLLRLPQELYRNLYPELVEGMHP
jgi:hypothetical protein